MAKVSIDTTVDIQIRERLREIAARRGQSLSEYVRVLIIADLERRKMLPSPDRK